MNYVITIGRQMGSGGRLLGRMIADRLGIAFYDKTLLQQAAVDAGLSAEYFEQNDERAPRVFGKVLPFGMSMAPLSLFASASVSADDTLYRTMCDFMHDIAAKGPCVIVGRSADYVLRDMPNVVNIFVHADLDDCAARICERDPELSIDQARTLATRTNKLRANFYNFYTEKRWGDAASYDLCFNSSKLSLGAIADITIDYLHALQNTNLTK